MKPNSVSVYPLADPAMIAGAGSAILKILQQAAGGSEDDGELQVDPNTGMLRFVRPSLLDTSEGALGKPENAEQAARRFLDAVRAYSASLRSADGRTLPNLLPPILRTTGLSIGVNSAGDPAHWVVRFTPLISPGLVPQSGLISMVAGTQKDNVAGQAGSLPAAATMPVIGSPGGRVLPVPPSPPAPPPAPSPELPVAPPVDVVNAIIDVRVTSRGSICALTSRWRPLAANEVITTGLLPEPQDEHANESETGPVIGYLVASDCDPQRFLAPYFLSLGHGGLVSAPASTYSLTALIIPVGSGEFRVMVSGNSSGQLRYGWAAYSLSQPEGGIVGLGSEDRVHLDPGIYNLIVDVMDLSTGAICRSESIAPVYPIESNGGMAGSSNPEGGG